MTAPASSEPVTLSMPISRAEPAAAGTTPCQSPGMPTNCLARLCKPVLSGVHYAYQPKCILLSLEYGHGLHTGACGCCCDRDTAQKHALATRVCTGKEADFCTAQKYTGAQLRLVGV